MLLLRLVAYLEGNSKIYFFIAVAFLMSLTIGKNIFRFRKDGRFLISCGIYFFLLLLVVVLHTFIFSELFIRDIAVLAAIFLWFVYVTTRFWNRDVDAGLRYILISFLIYNIANYVFNEISFGDAKIGINSTLGFFGIQGYRISFPLSSGANVNASQIGLCSLIAIYFYKNKRDIRKKLLYLLVFLFHVFLLVLADSRLILLVALIFSLFTFYSFTRVINFAKRYWLALSISLILMMYFFYSTDVFESIKRPGEKSGRVLNRFEIWQVAIEVIFNDFRVITGRGLNGFANALTGELKEKFAAENLETCHNFMIQTLMDFGIFGLLLSLYGIQLIIVKAIKLRKSILLILLTAVLIFSTTEAIPTFYSFEATFFFTALVALIIIRYERENHQHT